MNVLCVAKHCHVDHVESNILRMCICIRTEEIEKFFNNWTSGSKEPFLEMEEWRTPTITRVCKNWQETKHSTKQACMTGMLPVHVRASLDKKETCETRKLINQCFFWGDRPCWLMNRRLSVPKWPQIAAINRINLLAVRFIIILIWLYGLRKHCSGWRKFNSSKRVKVVRGFQFSHWPTVWCEVVHHRLWCSLTVTSGRSETMRSVDHQTLTFLFLHQRRETSQLNPVHILSLSIFILFPKTAATSTLKKKHLR